MQSNDEDGWPVSGSYIPEEWDGEDYNPVRAEHQMPGPSNSIVQKAKSALQILKSSINHKDKF